MPILSYLYGLTLVITHNSISLASSYRLAAAAQQSEDEGCALVYSLQHE